MMLVCFIHTMVVCVLMHIMVARAIYCTFYEIYLRKYDISRAMDESMM